MKKFLAIVALVFLFGFALIYQQQIQKQAYNVLYNSPCDTPILFSIGSIDSRFNVTPNELLTDSNIAANIWNTTQNKQLLTYDPKATFTINMVYDSRQALTSEITQLNSNLKQQQGAINPRIFEFKKKQADFEAQVNSLNQQIQYWNSRGGAPKDEYDKLVAQQKSLQTEANSLNSTAKQLGQSTQEYNLNAEKLNNTINNYQEVLQNKPEEGLYEQIGNQRKISIYIDITKDEFLHTLAHEMGHSLQINHNSDPKSIMYPQTTSGLIPSTEDITELNYVCRKRLIFDIIFERIQEIVGLIETKLKK